MYDHVGSLRRVQAVLLLVESMTILQLIALPLRSKLPTLVLLLQISKQTQSLSKMVLAVMARLSVVQVQTLVT
jgi:hypothetical protein